MSHCDAILISTPFRSLFFTPLKTAVHNILSILDGDAICVVSLLRAKLISTRPVCSVHQRAV